MKCCCCISLRSAVYFGASIHIFLGTIQFGIFLMQSFLYIGHYFSKRPEQPSLTLMLFLILLVDAIFLPLGCLIFRGIEKENIKLIKIPMIIFFLTKVTEMSLKIVQNTIYSNPGRAKKSVDWEGRMYQIIDLTSVTLYVLLLFFYTRELVRAQRENISDYFKSPHSKKPNINIPTTSKLLSNPQDS